MLSRMAVLAAVLSPGAVAADEPAQRPTTISPSAAGVKAEKHPKLSSELFELARLNRTGGLPDAEAFAASRAITLVDAAIRVVIHTRREDMTAVKKSVEALGGTFESAASDLVLARVPVSALEALTSLEAVKVVRRPEAPTTFETPSQGVSVIGASAWHQAGYRGAGVKVAVLDVGFQGYQSLMGTDLPVIPAAHIRSFSGDITGGGDGHGTAVAEIVHDVAPNAELYLANASNEVELENAVLWLIEQRVNVINASWGFPCGGALDGTGRTHSLVQRAAEAGILWVNAAGNFARYHWSGTFNDSNDDRWNDFSATENANRVFLNSGEDVRACIAWDDWTVKDQDYDLYVWNSAGTVVASSTDSQSGPGTHDPKESVSFTASATGEYFVGIKRDRTTRNAAMQLNVYPAGAECAIAAVADTVSKRGGTLSSLRAFRDEVLKPSVSGQALIASYYRHSREAVRILLLHPSLALEAASLVRESGPAVSSVVEFRRSGASGSSFVITADLVARVESFLDQVAAFATPALSEELGTLRARLGLSGAAGETVAGYCGRLFGPEALDGAIPSGAYPTPGYMRYMTTQSSLVPPADSPYALTVGATNWATDLVEDFSSQGPTADGRLKPDLVAPDGVCTATYGDCAAAGFLGTSAAAPHVAGAAALVRELYSSATSAEIAVLLRSRVVDLPPAGPDEVSGKGRLALGMPGATCSLALEVTAPKSGNRLSALPFHATVAPSNCSGAIAVSWEFGDGRTSPLSEPNHVYSSPGAFRWKVTVASAATRETREGTIQIADAPATTPVLFVHGFCSSGEMWLPLISKLRASLPGHYVAESGAVRELYFDGTAVRDRADSQAYYPERGEGFHGIGKADVYTVSFCDPSASDIFRATAVNDVGIEREAVQLLKVIQAIVSVNQSGKVDLVGHSQGGLVARAYVEGQASDGVRVSPFAGDVRRVVTIDTPHAGSSLWDALSVPLLDCKMEDSLQRRQLHEGSVFLGQLNAGDIPPGLPLTAIVSYPAGDWANLSAVYECTEDDDCIVTVASQNLASQGRYRCNPSMPLLLSEANPIRMNLVTIQQNVHSIAASEASTAAIVGYRLIQRVVSPRQCGWLLAGTSTGVVTPAGSTGEVWDISLSFAGGRGVRAAGLAADGCYVDVVARSAGGQELDRKQVPGSGEQRVTFTRMLPGCSVTIEPKCDVDVAVTTSERVPLPNDAVAPALLVPIALDVTSGTAHYTTELTLTNRGTSWVRAAMRYSSSIGSVGTAGVAVVEAAPGSQTTIPDAIGELRRQGVPIPGAASSGAEGGTIRVDVSGATSDSTVSVVARTTTATTAPQAIGSAGLAYMAPQASGATGARATIYGLRQDARDRSNVAVFNPGAEPVTVRVTAFAGDGSGSARVVSNGQTLPGYGWYQWSGVLAGTGISSGWVAVERVSASGAFGSYGVINDNATNDGSFIPSTTPSVSGSAITVPVLVEASPFLSEMVLANRGGSPATLTLNYRESLSPSLGAGGSTAVTLRAGEQLIVPDAIGYLRGRGVRVGSRGLASYAGALRITVSGAVLADVYAGARTASQSAGGGQYGLFAAGVYQSEAAAAETFLYGLRSDDSNRSNVAVANAGGDSSGPVTVELHCFDGDRGGVEAGPSEKVTLAPGEWKQFSNILKTKGIRHGWVHVVRTSGSASWIAYGVINDGGNPGERTGDGAYVPMAPGDSTN